MGRLRSGFADKPAESVVSCDFEGLAASRGADAAGREVGHLVMGRDQQSRAAIKRVIAGLALGVLSLDGAAAADIPLKAPRIQQVYDWTGFYAGGHLGYGRGHATDRFANSITVVPDKPVGSLFGGLQFGYNHVLNSGILV